MKLDTDMTSQNFDKWNTSLQKKGGDIHIPEKDNSLKLKLDSTLDVANISQQLAQWLESKLTWIDLQEWKNSLKSLLPKELQNHIDNITVVDIAQMIALVLGAVILIASGVGIPVAIGSIWVRLGAGAMIMRIWTLIASRPNITSAMMGLVPGMKNVAPNQAISFGVSEAKNMILYILHGLVTSRLANSRK